MFDVLFVLVVGISTAFAAMRGGLRELSTILALALAGGLTYLLAEPLIGAVRLEGSLFGIAGLAAVLLSVFFIAAQIGLHFALKRVPLSGWGGVADRVGGGAFGFARGLVLVGLAYLGYNYYVDEMRQPDYVKNAMTRPVAAGVAHLFESMAPESAYIENTALPTPGEDATVQGYNRGDRNGLSEIVTTVTTTDEAAPDPATEEEPSDEDAIADILKEDEE